MARTGDDLPVYIPPWERDRKERIRKASERRGIQYLVHFTQVGNVPSILEHGLLSRRELDKRGIPYRWNDENRFDEALDAISLSISFPNYRMFFRLRQHKRNEGARWVVLMLSSAILWEYKCTYHYTNAARKEFRDKYRGDLQSLGVFEGMFAPEIRGISRDPDIPPFYTTDPQAEVLIFQRIPTEKVLEVCVENRESLESLKLLIKSCNYQKLKIGVCKRFFKPRQDHERW